MLVSDFIDEVRSIYNDEDSDNYRQSDSDLIRYINAGLRQMLLFRPDMNATNSSMELVAGTRQTIPTDGFRLIEVIRNTTSQTPITFVERALLDTFNNLWHEADTADIEHFFMYSNNPKTFWVTPPATEGHSIDIVYAKNFDTLADTSESLPIDDVYIGALTDYALYRCYSKDDGSAVNPELASSYRQSFYMSIGAELNGTDQS